MSVSQIPGDGPDRQTDRAQEAGEVFTAALSSDFAERHARVDCFVARHFTVGGSLALHREALGWDLLRVPVNLLLSVPTAALKAGAVVARLLGAASLAHWLDTRDLFLKTAVARRIEHLIRTELLGLPADRNQGGSPSDDALFAGVVADPIQRHLGVHQRRLHRMLDVLEANLRGPARESLAVKDHYVARLLDLLDLLDYAAAASRLLRSG